MNRHGLESMKRSSRKSILHLAFIAISLLVLSSAIFTGCKNEKKENANEWKKLIGNDKDRPDLILAFQAEIHTNLYARAVEKFNRENNCKVALLRVKKEMLMEPLQDAMELGGDVPDLVELLEGTMGYFADGPIEDVGFVDLTDRLREDGYMDLDNIVLNCYSPWSACGHIFAIPHYVHPVALCYRVDLIRKLGIDVTKLKTWNDFVKVGREITGEWEESDEYAHITKGSKRYMIDLDDNSMVSLQVLLSQRGLNLFDANGNVAFDNPEMAELIAWYIHQTCGVDRISTPAGDGQNFYNAMKNGHDLFFFTPDGRTMQYTMDLNFDSPSSFLRGKLALMPMPVWADENGDRLPGTYGTGTWGGMGLAITKHCKNQELAWKLAKYLYLEAGEDDFVYNFQKTNILPAVKRVWSAREFNEASPYFWQMVRNDQGNLNVVPISIGRFYASIADDTAPRYFTAQTSEAEREIMQIIYDVRGFYESHQTDSDVDERMLELIRKKLKESADRIRSSQGK